MASIDLNADLGEGFGVWRLGDDNAMLGIVTSANVACGFHAGDPTGLLSVCRLAAERGVRIGAQVSYRDLAGFGRRFIDVTPEDLLADVVYQIGALHGLAQAAGSAEVNDALVATIPFLRRGNPEELANAIVFISSPEASYISGTVFDVDGGMSAT